MRLDQFIKETYQIKSRAKAQDLIRRGKVLINGNKITKTGYEIKNDSDVLLLSEFKYVSRGGEKLEKAINYFNIGVENKTFIDIGASTGGFTDCLIKHGASLVYAYDVGINQLADELKQSNKVISYEKTNILNIVKLPKHDLVVMDLSFTSVKPVLNKFRDQFNEVLFLFKPQFETDKKHLKKGIVKDLKHRDKLIIDITQYLKQIDYHLIGYIPSPITGKDGNQEFLFYIKVADNK